MIMRFPGHTKEGKVSGLAIEKYCAGIYYILNDVLVIV